jgi:drug/metabolite transporter (DMT)-like permease
MTGDGSFSIWQFIGLLVGVYGVLILVAGIHDAISPPAVPLALANLHAAIWWGALLILFGAACLFFSRSRRKS